jgi:phosphotransferase family enzyme
MRERPPLSDRALLAALADGWGVAAAAVEFLPVGDDAGAWSFRAVAGDGGRRFLKVRRGPVDPATVRVPMFLRDHGLEQVVAALPAGDGDPWRPLGSFTLLVYPWVDGARLGQGRPGDSLVRERLGRVVAAARPELVLCHADLHLANLLVDDQDRLAVVDWDGLELAPPERDLCFFVTETAAGERARFFEGHGPATPDRAALAYYRWEWVVQELADYGGRVVDDRLGEATRRHALAEFRRLFAPGDVVELARRVDRDLTVSCARGRRGGRRAGGGGGSRRPPPGRPGG